MKRSQCRPRPATKRSNPVFKEISTVITGARPTGIQTGGGQLIISDSGGLNDPPTPPPPPAALPAPSAPEPAKVDTKSVSAGSPVCRY